MVCSIEPDGMTNACTRKVLSTRAITSATTTSSGTSVASDLRRLRLTLRASLRRSIRVLLTTGVGRRRPRTARPPAVTHAGRPRARARRRRRPGCRSRVQWPGGQAIQSARPITSSTGTVPPPGSPRWSRESAESSRWSPMTHSLPSGTTMSNGTREGASPGCRYALVQRMAVDRHPALLVAAGDAVAADADDALDVVGPAARPRRSPCRRTRSRLPAGVYRRSGTPACRPVPGRRSAACSPWSRWAPGRAPPRSG